MPGFCNGCSRTTVAGCTRALLSTGLYICKYQSSGYLLQLHKSNRFCCSSIAWILLLVIRRAVRITQQRNQLIFEMTNFSLNFFTMPIPFLAGSEYGVDIKPKIYVGMHLKMFFLLASKNNKPYFLCASDLSISLCLIEPKNLPSCLFNVVT